MVKKVIIIESERSMKKFMEKLCCQMDMSCYLIDDVSRIIVELKQIDYNPDLIIVNMQLSDDIINAIVCIIKQKEWHCATVGLGFQLDDHVYVKDLQIKTFNRPVIISQLAKYLGKIFNVNYLATMTL